MKITAPVHIRWMVRADLPAILQIENASFEFPWSTDDFRRTVKHRNCIGMVAERGANVVGFFIYELHRERLHVLNFAVHPSDRRTEVGRQMFAKLREKLPQQGRTRILLEVRESNIAAQLFFKSCGCRAIKVLRDFYEDTTEDAYLFQFSTVADRIRARQKANGV